MAVYPREIGRLCRPEWGSATRRLLASAVGGPAKAIIVEDGPDRDELCGKLVAIMDQFAVYETKTDRRIPMVILERAD